ncbi:hypothetical protein [Deinococcus sp.]|uniref:hypothetical protein n=1 Tax=Deinococcus sp. TaxID=47478 RepID=UPI003CC63C79
MISFKRTDALHPEKESVFSLNLVPLLVFVLGYALTRSLFGHLQVPASQASENGAGA